MPCVRMISCHGRPQVSTEVGLSLSSEEPHWSKKAGYLERVLVARSPCFERAGEAWKTCWLCVDGLGVQQADINQPTLNFAALQQSTRGAWSEGGDHV